MQKNVGPAHGKWKAFANHAYISYKHYLLSLLGLRLFTLCKFCSIVLDGSVSSFQKMCCFNKILRFSSRNQNLYYNFHSSKISKKHIVFPLFFTFHFKINFKRQKRNKIINKLRWWKTGTIIYLQWMTFPISASKITKE